jgi:arabinose-5-phosphate isomerase
MKMRRIHKDEGMYNQGKNAHVARVRELLALQVEAITRATQRLQAEQVAQAVEVLAACKGKIILVGIGKSGIVARKLAATFTSTGTVGVYLHPVEALHGDLGLVTPEDATLVLSNSGETDELLAIVPYLKHRRVPIIAIVGNLHSTLAHQADLVLDATVDKEACPLNLVPTASTTVAMAIGDALAMTLMHLKGLTPRDFALNHPAGQLGKRLTLCVGSLMHSGPENPTILPDAPWLEIVSTISQGGLGAVNVVETTGRLVGLITDGDLRRAMQNLSMTMLTTLRAEAIMTHDPVVVTPEVLAYAALQLMENRPSQISVLPVVDHEQSCVGLLRLHDIVRSGLS